MSIRGREGRLAATKLSLEQQVSDFIFASGDNSSGREWLRAYASEIYVRRYYHQSRGMTLDIANITIRRENQRQGIFRHFLGVAERIAHSAGYTWVRVENVLHPGLAKFLEKRGYRVIRDDAGVPTYEYDLTKGPPIF